MRFHIDVAIANTRRPSCIVSSAFTTMRSSRKSIAVTSLTQTPDSRTKTSRMGVDKLKKENRNLKRVCIVIGIVVLGIVSLLLGYYTAPVDGDEDPPETRDEHTHLVPITENATVSVIVNHTGTTSVMPSYNDPHNSRLVFPVLNHILITKDDILNNFDRVYIFILLRTESSVHEYDMDNYTLKQWQTTSYEIHFMAMDGSKNIVAYESSLIIDLTLDDKFIHCTVDYHDADQTIYTFHYPKIIGWEDP